MKKFVVILLVLLLGLLGVEGCAPGMDGLRPEWIKKMKKIEKEPSIEIKDFRKHFGLK